MKKVGFKRRARFKFNADDPAVMFSIVFFITTVLCSVAITCKNWWSKSWGLAAFFGVLTIVFITRALYNSYEKDRI